MHRVAERGLVSKPGVRELGPVFKHMDRIHRAFTKCKAAVLPVPGD